MWPQDFSACGIAPGVIFNLQSAFLSTSHGPMETTSFKDRSVTLMPMSGIDRYHLGHVSTPAQHAYLYSLHISLTSHLRTYRTHIALLHTWANTVCPCATKVTFHNRLHFSTQCFDFEAALTRGYSPSIFKALYREGSTQYLPTLLSCMSFSYFSLHSANSTALTFSSSLS